MLRIALICLSLLFCHVGSAESAGGQTESAVDWLNAHGGDAPFMLLGEKHGTREIPRFVADFLRAQPEDQALTLGLEYPCSEQSAFERFLDSDGGAAARAALRASSYWQVTNDQHDGRRSEDMLDLLEAVRQIRASGRDIAVLAYDLAPGTKHDHHSRDKMMAESLRAARQERPDRRLLVLTGNVHAMKARPSYAPPEMQQPMASYLADLKPLAVNIEANSGEFWGCRGSCGPVAAGNSGATHRVEQGGPYDLRLVLPEFSVARLLGGESAQSQSPL
ncbi:MAG: calcium-binding protein [Lysobacterales bacterium]|nr:calcium-binding protein [Xanthomonadales bacterium]